MSFFVAKTLCDIAENDLSEVDILCFYRFWLWCIKSALSQEAERKAFSAKFQNNYERALADMWFRNNFEMALADTRDARDSEIERIKDLKNKVLDPTSGRGMLPSHA